MAHNLTRWVEAIGLHEAPPMTPKTMRRRLLRVPGRLTRSGRRSSLHLPTHWPWAAQFQEALRLVRAVPLTT